MASSDHNRRGELEGTLDAYRHNAAQHAAMFSDVVTPQMQWIIAETNPGDLVLDVGCGTGRDVRMLRSAGRAAVGVDLVIEMLASVAGGVVCDARAMPFGDSVFDAVYSSAGLVHLERDAFGDAVREMVRVGREGAAFSLSVRHRQNGEDESGWEPSSFGARWYQRWDAADLCEVLDRCGVVIDHVDVSLDSKRGDVSWVAVGGCVRA